MSEVVADTTRVLGIQLRHATTKHAQTIGILERCHASLKEALKISTGERRTMWHQFVPTATLNYNTTYHSAIGCVSQALLHFPHLTYAIAADDNETVSRHHKVTKNQLTIMPDQCITTEAGINLRTITNTTGIIHPTEQYSGEPALYPRSQTQKLKYGSPTHHRILSPSKRMQMSRKSLYCHPKKLNNSIHSIRQPSRS